MARPRKIVPFPSVGGGGEGRIDYTLHPSFRQHHSPPLTASERRLSRWMQQNLSTFGASSLIRRHGARAILELLHDGIMLWDEREGHYRNPRIRNHGAFLRFALEQQGE